MNSFIGVALSYLFVVVNQQDDNKGKNTIAQIAYIISFFAMLITMVVKMDLGNCVIGSAAAIGMHIAKAKNNKVARGLSALLYLICIALVIICYFKK